MSIMEILERARQLDQAGEQIGALTLELKGALPLLHLAAYASDAMRVLSRVEKHAQRAPDFEQLMRFICPDWHNPGAIHDPSDLVSEVLMRLATDLQMVVKRMEDALSVLAKSEADMTMNK